MIRLAISADGHVNEPGDLWRTSLPAALRERGPRMEVRDGMIAMVVEGRVIRKLVGPKARAGAGPRRTGWSSAAIAGARDAPAERLAALAGDGV